MLDQSESKHQSNNAKTAPRMLFASSATGRILHSQDWTLLYLLIVWHDQENGLMHHIRFSRSRTEQIQAHDVGFDVAGGISSFQIPGVEPAVHRLYIGRARCHWKGKHTCGCLCRLEDRDHTSARYCRAVCDTISKSSRELLTDFFKCLKSRVAVGL